MEDTTSVKKWRKKTQISIENDGRKYKIEEIIERLEKGESVHEIAKTCNRNPMSVYLWDWARRVPDDIKNIVRDNIFMTAKQMKNIKELREVPLYTLNRVRSLERKKLLKEAESENE